MLGTGATKDTDGSGAHTSEPGSISLLVVASVTPASLLASVDSFLVGWVDESISTGRQSSLLGSSLVEVESVRRRLFGVAEISKTKLVNLC